MHYHNLDIWIEKHSEGIYAVRARSEQGEDKDVTTLDLQSLQQNVERLRLGQTDGPYLIELGIHLYDFLFRTQNRDIEAHFNQCFGKKMDEDEGVRLRLRIDAPEIAALPWEYLYWKRKARFLGTSIHTPLVRYLELPHPIKALKTELPLRMLVVIPKYTGNATLDTEAEKTFLLEAIKDLKNQGKIQETILDGTVTRAAISEALLEHQYHLFHFIGHGTFKDDKASLLLSGTNGKRDYVGHEQFARRFFLNHPTMKLAVLNSCKGAQVSTTQPLVGMGHQLVKQGLPAVVAMQYAIYDDEALCFAQAFYQSLFRGWGRGRVEIAMAHARNLLADEFPNRRALGVPVLFMHASEGVLFDVVRGNKLQDTPYGPEALDTANAVIKTYDQNIEISEDAVFIAGQEQAREEVKQRIRFRNISLAVATCVALLTFFGSWIALFDWLPKYLKPEHYTVWIGDLFDTKELHEDLVLVTIDKETTNKIGRSFDETWRAEHAQVVENLAKAGARVVTLGFYFHPETSSDSAFAHAIHEAESLGTEVVVGVIMRQGADQPYLVEALRDRRWGGGCVGFRRNTPNVYPLHATSGDFKIPSLALETIEAYKDATDSFFDDTILSLIPFNDSGKSFEPVRVADVEVIQSVIQGNCPLFYRGDSIANMILHYTPLDTLNKRRLPYEHFINPPDRAALANIKEKIVLIFEEQEGIDKGFSIWRGLRSETRYGMHLQTDAINTLLRGVAIRWLPEWTEFPIIVLMAIVGALLAWGIRLRHLIMRLGFLGLVLVGYMMGTVYLYIEYSYLLNAFYHVLALLVSYWTVRIVKRWGRDP